VSRLTFTVTVENKHDRFLGKSLPVYTLTGRRGAVYSTMRNVKNPNVMFLVNNRTFGVAMDGTWLTDKNGVLEVL
jgi:hypothetical protein